MSALRSRPAFALAALFFWVGCGPSLPDPPPSSSGQGAAQAGSSGDGRAQAAGTEPGKLAVAGDPGGAVIAGDPAGTQGAGVRPDVGSSGARPADACGAQNPPPRVRTGGSLVVESPPRPPTRTIPTRMRTHSEGALSASSKRVWVGPDVPAFVHITAGTLELTLLDPVSVSAAASKPDGFLAFYRDPYDASSCSLSSSANCKYGAALFHCAGKLAWVLELNTFFSRPDQLEVQDIRYDGGVLYFNEACQTYAKEAGGKCSSLVAVDPAAKKVLWRTPPLTSNNVFFVAEKYLITGYGFTAEPDFLFVVRRSDGAVVQRVPIAAWHEGMRVEGSDLFVSIYGDKLLRFKMEDFGTDKPRLVKLADPPPSPRPQPRDPLMDRR